MNHNNIKEIKGYIDNQGMYRGDNYIVVSIFYFLYQINDLVLIETDEGIEEKVLTEADLLCDCGFGLKNVLGLIFKTNGKDYKPNNTTTKSG